MGDGDDDYTVVACFLERSDQVCALRRVARAKRLEHDAPGRRSDKRADGGARDTGEQAKGGYMFNMQYPSAVDSGITSDGLLTNMRTHVCIEMDRTSGLGTIVQDE